MKYFSLWMLFNFAWTICNGDNHQDAIGYGGMVSSTHYLASEAGKRILEAGGTAADAAFAVQNMVNVLQPQSMGIGGCAFIMYYDAATQTVAAIDGREEAPAAYNPYVFCANVTCFESNGSAPGCENCATIPYWERTTGGLSVGVPGALHAFKRLYETYGAGEDVVSWADVFAPAIELASDGFPVYQGMLDWINLVLPFMSRFESSCKLLLNYPHCNASRFAVGDIITFPELNKTFSKLASLTPDEAMTEFYTGDMAEAIVATTQIANPATGRAGVMTLDDMAAYKAVFREPVVSTATFHGATYDVYGMNMPSSGPLTLVYQMKLLEYMINGQTDTGSLSSDAYSADALHYAWSAGNVAFADRNQYMADQDFVNVAVDGFLDDAYIQQRADAFMQATAQSPPIDFGFPDGWNDTFASGAANESGTAHFCVVDKWGNMASVTSTVEGPFGSKLVVDGYGFFLNNELTDFNSVGIVDGEMTANGPEGGKKARRSALDSFNTDGSKDSESLGGKRPRSSMSPVIVLVDGDAYMAAGANGGSTIIGTTARIVFNHLIYGMGAQEAVNAARLWGRNGASVQFEKSLWEATNANITGEMVAKYGYDESALTQYSFGSGNTIIVASDGLLHCGVDSTRVDTQRCAAVCNETDSSCAFALTTAYPDTTVLTAAESTQDEGDTASVYRTLSAVVVAFAVLYLNV